MQNILPFVPLLCPPAVTGFLHDEPRRSRCSNFGRLSPPPFLGSSANHWAPRGRPDQCGAAADQPWTEQQPAWHEDGCEDVEEPAAHCVGWLVSLEQHFHVAATSLPRCSDVAQQATSVPGIKKEAQHVAWTTRMQSDGRFLDTFCIRETHFKTLSNREILSLIYQFPPS